MAEKLSVRQRIVKYTDLGLAGLGIKNTDYRDWIILGGGKVKKSERSDEFDLELVCVPMKDGEILKDNISKTILLPTGALGIIRPRTVVTNGQFNGLYRENALNKTIKLLNPRESIIVEGSDFLPEKQLGNFSELNKTRYAKLDVVLEGQKLEAYVQCLELLRFYYGSSNGLLNCCFKAEKAESTIYNPKLPKKIGGIHFVRLRKYLYETDVPAAARIRFCDYAKEQFHAIRNKTLSKDTNPDKWITLLPPIKEEGVKWNVNCKFVKGRFIITNINSCFAHLPFKHILFDRDNDNNKVDEDNRIIKKKERPVIIPPPSNPEKPNNVTGDGNENDGHEGEEKNKEPPKIGGTSSGASPDINIETEQLDFSAKGGQFGDLQNISIDKLKKVKYRMDEKQTVNYIEGTVEDIDHYGTAKARNQKSGTAKLSVIASRKKNGRKPESDLTKSEIHTTSAVLSFLSNRLGIYEANFIQLYGYEFTYEGVKYSTFPYEIELAKSEKKPNEFSNLLIRLLDINVENDCFTFAFVEFYDKYFACENRSSLLLNITGIDTSEIDRFLKCEIRLFRENGRAWAESIIPEYDYTSQKLIEKEIDTKGLSQEKKLVAGYKRRLVHAQKNKYSIQSQVKKYIQRLSEIEPKLLNDKRVIKQIKDGNFVQENKDIEFEN